jgi:homoserine kinase
VRITRRPGPLAVRVTGEGASELHGNGENLICEAMSQGLADLDGLLVECENRIPLGRGLGSSAAAICAGLVAANALGGHRWSPDELLRRAAALEGHADNAAACILGGIVAVGPGPRAVRIAPPEGLVFVMAVPETRVSTEASRGALPAEVPLGDAADTLARAIGLVLALEQGRLEDLPEMLVDRLHEPYRARLVPGLAALRGLAGTDGFMGATISGSGPSVLAWCRREAVGAVAERARAALAAEGVAAEVRIVRVAPGGVSARWTGAEGRLATAIG